MAGTVSKWAAGGAYGPVLSQTDLYVLNAPVEIHPILKRDFPDFQLMFNLATGETGGFTGDSHELLPFTAKDEPATLPRVNQVIIITPKSPWCTVVKNERGVTLADVCTHLWKDYTENAITEAEITAVPPRKQEQVKRTAMSNAQNNGWGMYYSPSAQQPQRCRRIDWLLDRFYFDGLERDDGYAQERLGFKAPNILILRLSSY